MNVTKALRNLFTANDMTVGTPWKCIARFAFPMLIGNFAQQLYNTVDAVVVGRSKWGYTALAAVGNALPVLNLLLALFVGIATGVGILVAQYFGAKDREGLEKTIGSCIFISLAASIVIMVAGPLLTTPMLRAVNTLPEMFDACRDYLNIFFIGIIGFMFYNIFAGILRGLGDSFSALLFLLICAALNVAGDLLLVGKMGVAGVALATVISQAISAVLCLLKLLAMKDVFTLKAKNIRPNRAYLARIIRLGIPSGITQSLQGVIRGAGDTVSPMWITIATTVLIRIPLAYGLVWLARSMGADVLMQESMIYISLLSVWLIGSLLTVIVYFKGRWRKFKVPGTIAVPLRYLCKSVTVIHNFEKVPGTNSSEPRD